MAVFNECKRVMLFNLTSINGGDSLSEIMSMPESEVAAASLPDYSGEEKVDWSFVAREVGSAHTPQECRTRWLMVERPGRNHTEWNAEELTMLRQALEEYTNDDGARRYVCDWDAISRKVGNGRLAVDCLTACQQHDMLPASAELSAKAWANVPFTEEENQALAKLDATWDNHHSILVERMANNRPKPNIMSRVSRLRHARTVEPEHWDAKADEALIAWVVKMSHRKRLTVLENPSLAEHLDFSLPFRLKPYGMTAEQTRARWYTLADDYKTRPHHYIRDNNLSTIWTPESDAKLVKLIHEIVPSRKGRIAWRSIGKAMGLRMSDCKRRYIMHISKQPYQEASDHEAIALSEPRAPQSPRGEKRRADTPAGSPSSRRHKDT